MKRLNKNRPQMVVNYSNIIIATALLPLVRLLLHAYIIYLSE